MEDIKIREMTVECARNKFGCVEFEFRYCSDKNDAKLLELLIEEGKKLAIQVNPTLARDASRKRDFNTVETNCVAGVIAECCWRYWLNSEAEKLKLKTSVESAVFRSIDRHVDILVSYPDGTQKTVEVRSSFPYTGLENAVCRVFDIIGWYVNPVKTKEIRKDYYVRTLYPFKTTELYDRIKADSFYAYLTGGATRLSLEQSPHARQKQFIPYDDVDAMLSTQLGVYQVIEPIVNGYDTVKISELIIEGTDC